jgi:hypothetical protein
MPTELFDPQNVFNVAFKVDADINWGEVHAFETTNRKVEGKGTIADFIASRPMTATLEGVVTAMAVGDTPASPQKLVNARDDLIQLANKKQPVLVLNDQFAGYLAITSAEPSVSVDRGKALGVRIAFKQIETTTTATAQVPASKLKAKIKRVGGAGKKGGAAKGSTPSEADKSLLARGDDRTGRRISGALR